MKIVHQTSFEQYAPPDVNEYRAPPGVISTVYIWKFCSFCYLCWSGLLNTYKAISGDVTQEVYSECRRFLLRLPFHAQRKPWGEIEKSCSHTFGCHNLFNCERQLAVSLSSQYRHSFRQHFIHCKCFSCNIYNFYLCPSHVQTHLAVTTCSVVRDS